MRSTGRASDDAGLTAPSAARTLVGWRQEPPAHRGGLLPLGCGRCHGAAGASRAASVMVRGGNTLAAVPGPMLLAAATAAPPGRLGRQRASRTRTPAAAPPPSAATPQP